MRAAKEADELLFPPSGANISEGNGRRQQRQQDLSLLQPLQQDGGRQRRKIVVSLMNGVGHYEILRRQFGQERAEHEATSDVGGTAQGKQPQQPQQQQQQQHQMQHQQQHEAKIVDIVVGVTSHGAMLAGPGKVRHTGYGTLTLVEAEADGLDSSSVAAAAAGGTLPRSSESQSSHGKNNSSSDQASAAEVVRDILEVPFFPRVLKGWLLFIVLRQPSPSRPLFDLRCMCYLLSTSLLLICLTFF